MTQMRPGKILGAEGMAGTVADAPPGAASSIDPPAIVLVVPAPLAARLRTARRRCRAREPLAG